ncbi:unnamed protein product [Linum tenue]|uniref:Uncharacterized protein n=1 Tax=Linum tenue TaxID=586396 RepID=A0AAV0R2C9_9ROSI|nr:unnamed protein product [Linum tenue]
MGRKRSASSTPEPAQVATSPLPSSGSPNPQSAIPNPGDSVASPKAVNKSASSSKKKVKMTPGGVRRSNRLKSGVRTTTETEAQEIERIIEEITSTDSEEDEEEDQQPNTVEEAKEVEEEEQEEEEAGEVPEEDQHPVVGKEGAKEVEEDLVLETNEIGDCWEGLVEICKRQKKTMAELQAQDAARASRAKKRSSAAHLTYKGLYFDTIKEVVVLQEENRRLIKELEYARGRDAGLTDALKLTSKSCCCSRAQ